MSAKNPQASKQSSTKKDAPIKKRRNRAQETHQLRQISEIEEIDIYQELMMKDPSKSRLIQRLEEIIQDQEQDRAEILKKSVLIFLLKSVGLSSFACKLEDSNVAQINLPDFFKESFEGKAKNQIAQRIDEPFGKRQEFLPFQENFKKFCQIIFGKNSMLVESPAEILDVFATYITHFARCGLRHVRAQVIKMVEIQIDAACKCLSSIQKEKEEAKKSSNEPSRARLSEISQNTQAYIEKLFFDVVCDRLLDASAEIRARALKVHHSILYQQPEQFTSAKCFELVLTLLSDPDCNIRVEALEELASICQRLQEKKLLETLRTLYGLCANQSKSAIFQNIESGDKRVKVKTLALICSLTNCDSRYLTEADKKKVYRDLFTDFGEPTEMIFQIILNSEFEAGEIPSDNYEDTNFARLEEQTKIAGRFLVKFIQILATLRSSTKHQNIEFFVKHLFLNSSVGYSYVAMFDILLNDELVSDKNEQPQRKTPEFQAVLIAMMLSSAAVSKKIARGILQVPRHKKPRLMAVQGYLTHVLKSRVDALCNKVKENINSYGQIIGIFKYFDEITINDGEFLQQLTLILQIMRYIYESTFVIKHIRAICEVLEAFSKNITHNLLKSHVVEFARKCAEQATVTFNLIESQSMNLDSQGRDTFDATQITLCKLASLLELVEVSDEIDTQLIQKIAAHRKRQQSTQKCEFHTLVFYHQIGFYYHKSKMLRLLTTSGNFASQVEGYQMSRDLFFRESTELLSHTAYEELKTSLGSKKALQLMELACSGMIEVLSFTSNDKLKKISFLQYPDLDQVTASFTFYMELILGAVEKTPDTIQKGQVQKEQQRNQGGTSAEEKDMPISEQMEVLEQRLDNVEITPSVTESSVGGFLANVMKLFAQSSKFSVSSLASRLLILLLRADYDHAADIRDLLKILKKNEVAKENQDELILWKIVHDVILELGMEFEASLLEFLTLVQKTYFLEKSREDESESLKKKFVAFIVHFVDCILNLPEDKFLLFKFLALLIETKGSLDQLTSRRIFTYVNNKIEAYVTEHKIDDYETNQRFQGIKDTLTTLQKMGGLKKAEIGLNTVESDVELKKISEENPRQSLEMDKSIALQGNRVDNQEIQSHELQIKEGFSSNKSSLSKMSIESTKSAVSHKKRPGKTEDDRLQPKKSRGKK